MINIVKMKEICFACPSSWEGWDEKGMYYHFRYRWGTLRVDQAISLEDWQSPVSLSFGATPNGKCETIYEEQLGDNLDGFMNYETLRGTLHNEFVFPDDCLSRHDEDF